jgi:hypothetical protein
MTFLQLWGIYCCKSGEFLLQLCPFILCNKHQGESEGSSPYHKETGGRIMFYTKLMLQDNGELITYLTDDNIYGNCPICGKEISIDLAEVLSEEDRTLGSIKNFVFLSLP